MGVKALTIRQPWASLIMAGAKDVENRTWKVQTPVTVLVHAGKVVERDEETRAYVAARATWPERMSRGALLGAMRIVECTETSESPWAIAGSWHWCIGAVVPFEHPVPCLGTQGLWEVPMRLSERVRRVIASLEATDG